MEIELITGIGYLIKLGLALGIAGGFYCMIKECLPIDNWITDIVDQLIDLV
jgi:hypothetical protein